MIPPVSPSPDHVPPVQGRPWPFLAASLAAIAIFSVVLFLRPTDVSQPLADANPVARATNEQEKSQPSFAKAPLSAPANPTVANETSPEQLPEPDALPREKRELLQKIATDYDELSQPIYTAATGVIPQEDRDKLKLLDQEKIADLATVLNPTELEAYHYLSSVSVPLRRR